MPPAPWASPGYFGGSDEAPSAAIIHSRTLRSTPESGPPAGYDGAKRKRGSKLHRAVDTPGHLLALHVTPANVDQGYTGDKPAEAARQHGIDLCAVKLAEAKKEFVLLPKRWSSSDPSPGRPDVGAWLKITNAALQPSPARMSSPSSA